MVQGGFTQEIIMVWYSLWVFPVVVQDVMDRSFGAIICCPAMKHVNTNGAFQKMRRNFDLGLTTPRFQILDLCKCLEGKFT